eukprot:2548395-Prymnesium_polylepis.2
MPTLTLCACQDSKACVAQAECDRIPSCTVTCPITGQTSTDGSNPHGASSSTVHVRPGFFASSVRDPLTKGMQNLKDSY